MSKQPKTARSAHSKASSLTLRPACRKPECRTKYQYDALNRLTNVSDGAMIGTQNTAYSYDSEGHVQSLRYPTGVTNAYRYDALNRLTNLIWNSASAQLASFSYALMAGGTRTNALETLDGISYTNRWSYDSIYRLTSEAILAASGSGTNVYTYDAVGNRLTRTVTGFGAPFTAPTNQSFNFDKSDRLDNDADPTTASSWSDANGNTTNYAGTFQYDVENHLTNANGAAVMLVYNGDGQLVCTIAGGVTNLYLIDSVNPSGHAQVLEELTVGLVTHLVSAFTYGLNVISQRQPGLTTNFYGLDGHGSVRFLLTPAAAISDSYVYDAYGVPIRSSGITTNHKGYCAEQIEPELGLINLRNRLLDANAGRFRTSDSHEGELELPLSLHHYLYCHGNPVNNLDPTGNDVEGALASVDVTSTLSGLDVPSLSPDPAGHGGPDITDTLKRTLDDVSTWYNSLTNQMNKYISGQYLIDTHAGDAWDIHDLRALIPGYGGYNYLSFPGLKPKDRFECGTGQYTATVEVKGEVYDASAVNYAIYGKMNRLVYDWYKSNHDPVSATWFTLTAAKARVRIFKRFFNDDFTYETGFTAEAFTAWGYNGSSLPKGFPTSSSGEVVNADKFEWKWMPYHP